MLAQIQRHIKQFSETDNSFSIFTLHSLQIESQGTCDAQTRLHHFNDLNWKLEKNFIPGDAR